MLLMGGEDVEGRRVDGAVPFHCRLGKLQRGQGYVSGRPAWRYTHTMPIWAWAADAKGLSRLCGAEDAIPKAILARVWSRGGRRQGERSTVLP
jgi:hypothetical protein